MKTKERIKTILLLVLLCGAVLLTYLIWTDYAGKMPGVENEQNALLAGAAYNQEWAIPFAISFKNDNGRFGAAFHGASVKSVYDSALPFIGEAIDGGTVQKTDEQAWVSAIAQKGILVDFEGNIPVAIIAKELGVSAKAEDAYCRYMLVCANGVYFKNVQQNMCYVLVHDLGAERLDAALRQMKGSRCVLAYDMNLTRVVGETPIFTNSISSKAINAINATDNLSDSQMDTLLKVFGMNYNTCGKHIEQDGSRVYIEEKSTLKISPEGVVSFKSEEEGESALSISSKGKTPTREETVEGAGNIMSTLNSFAGGEASLYLREIREDGTLKYGRSFGGIPIDKSGVGFAGEISLSGNRITQLSFQMRAYSSTETVVSALPQKLAIASVSAESRGVLSLRYNDSIGGGIEAQWYVKK